MQENDKDIRVYVEKEKKKKDRTTKIKFTFNTALSFIAYIGIGCIAVALLLTLIFKGDTNLSSAFKTVGQVIAYIISIILAYTCDICGHDSCTFYFNDLVCI